MKTHRGSTGIAYLKVIGLASRPGSFIPAKEHR